MHTCKGICYVATAIIELLYCYLSTFVYPGDPEEKTFTARASIWHKESHQKNWSWKTWNCQGKWVREICIFGVGDMPWLYHRPELFANKFHIKYQWLAYECLEELVRNRTLHPDPHFNTSYYENLPFVKHKEDVIPEDEYLASMALPWR